jgi:ABC-type molybdate transport system substrate-binding protein
MKPGPLVRSISMIGMAAFFMMRAGSAADVQVMISSGFHGAYSELAPAFERATGNHLFTTRGPSMGDSPETILARLTRGESADVVILDGGAADELGKRGLVNAASKVELARSLIGMVVREGAAKPDITSVAAFRNTLLAAKSIAYSDSGSGTYLSTVLFQKLGVADQIAPKSRISVQKLDAIGLATTPDDLAKLALVMTLDERQLKAISHIHRVIDCDPRPARRDVQNMALALRQTVVRGDPGQPLLQLPSRLALCPYPRLNNSHGAPVVARLIAPAIVEAQRI